MRVLFISANTEKMNVLPLPLGLHCVALATQRAGHDIRILDLMTHGDSRTPVREALDSFLPDAIGISVRNIDDQKMEPPRFLLDEVRDVVRLCRSRSPAPIALGGAGYSIFPEVSLAYLEADMGIQGEGEAVFPSVLARLAKGTGLSGIPGLYLRGRGSQGPRDFAGDLNELPISGVHRFSASCDRELWMPFQTRRGCPMDCSYCSTATVEGRKVRKRSPNLALEEMTRYVEMGFTRFYFVDNTFNLPESYAREICRQIIRRGLAISWRCILYPGKVGEDLIGLMAKAGCCEVSLGFESGCERILKAMNKKFSPAEVRETSRILADHGIRQMGFLMLGGPGETRESALESLAFADSLPIDTSKVSTGIRIYPGTALARLALAEGRIAPGESLLQPRFYVVREIEDWLRETVKIWMADRPHWMS